MQTCEQQLAGSLQGTPSGWQVPPPQMPSTHSRSQHSLAVVHGAPFPSQGPPQSPLVQACEQQSPGPSVHASPFGWQGPQRPAVHSPAQHCAGVVHGSRLGKHIPVPQVPFTQVPVQQAAEPLQVPPAGTQAPVHTPLEQSPLQQSLSCEQSTPTLKHVPPVPPVPPMPPAPPIPPLPEMVGE